MTKMFGKDDLEGACVVVIVAFGLLVFLLAGCSGAPGAQFNEYTNAPELTGFVMARDSKGRVRMDPRYSDGKIRSGPHRLGDGPDIWDSRGVTVPAVSLGDE